MRKKRILIFFYALCMLWCLLSSATADDQPVLNLHVGYGDEVFCGRYQPLSIRIQAGSEAIEGTAEIDISARSGMKDRISFDISVHAGEVFETTVPVITLVPQSSFTMTLRSGESVLARKTYQAERVIEPGAMVIGLPGVSGEALAQALSADETSDPLDRNETIHAAVIDQGTISGNERLMSAFDVMILGGGIQLTQEQKAYLTDWVRKGGILIAGAEKADDDTLAWAAELANISLLPLDMQDSEPEGVIEALMRYTDTVYQTEGLDVLPAFFLDADGADAAIGKDNAVAAVRYAGRGMLMIGSFDWADPLLIEANKEQAILRRVLLALDSERYHRIMENSGTPNYSIGTTAARIQRLDAGKSILPYMLLLAAYALCGGAGLYIFLRRKDRTRLLWCLLPALALVMCVMAAAAMNLLRLSEPAASSLRVTKFEDGEAEVQEIVHLGYRGQDRARISAATGERIERLSSGYASSYAIDEAELELRDVLREGDQPSIELPGAASWTTRDLVIIKDGKPQGSVTAHAEMTRSGLRAEITNGTDMQLEEAVLLTGVGYAKIGLMTPGQTVSVLIGAADEHRFSEEGNLIIEEGVMTPYTMPVYSVTDAYVYPEKQTVHSEKIEYSDAENYERSLKSALVRSGNTGDGGTFFCIFAAKAAEEEGTALTLDGRAINRHTHTGMFIADIRCGMKGSDGYVYIPKGASPALSVHEHKSGELISGAPIRNAYIGLDRDTVFAFRPEGIADLDVVRMVFTTDSWYELQGMTAEVYNHRTHSWTAVEGMSYVEITGELAEDAVSAAGEVFIRYTGQRESGMIGPEITVEGVTAK